MAKVTITGTGVPVLSPGRAGPGVLVEHGDIRLQFDAGRATALRLTEAGVSMDQLSALFVTHHHSDHLTGLTDVLFSRWLGIQGPFEPLPVVAPAGPATEFLDRMMDPWTADIAVRSAHIGRTDHPGPLVVEFDPDETVDEAAEVWSSAEGAVRVLARSVHHEPVMPAVAYRVETPDGAVVISGDTTVCDEVAELADGAVVLVHEALRRTQLLEFGQGAPHLAAIASYHADTVELGAMVERVGVPQVVLTHLIPPPGFGPTTKQDYVDDLRTSGYSGDVIIADDLTTVVFGD